MAYARVGAMGTVASGTTSVTPSFAQATTAGNLLIAWLSFNTGHLATSSSGWAIAALSAAAGSGNDICGIAYKPNCAASESAPTFTGTGTAAWAALAEFSGGATASPLDQIGGATSGVSPTVATCAAADIASGELLVSCSIDNVSKSSTQTGTDTYNNGATPSGNLNNDASTVFLFYRFAYGITTSKAAADQNSHASNNMNYLQGWVAVASFKLAAAAGAKSLVAPMARQQARQQNRWY